MQAALKTGQLDLYERAQQIGKKQAKLIVGLAQGQLIEPNTLDDVDGNITDDEEFNEEVNNLALGNLGLIDPTSNRIKAFDPDDSYFSEDDEELDKDEVKKWQKESHFDKYAKGSMMSDLERFMMESTFTHREQKKANKLKLDNLGDKIHAKIYNAKDILKKIKKAGVSGKQLEIDLANKEIKQLE